jgi:hypothetical protein
MVLIAQVTQGSLMDATTALLFQTHFFDRSSARAFARLRAGCPAHFRPIVLVHLAPGARVPRRLADVPHHIVRTPDLRTPDYPAKSSGPGWNLWSGGHTDLILMHFWRAQPHHARYWSVEYDVRFSGPWRRLFDSFEDEPADLLAPGLIRRDEDPDWYNWPSLLPTAPVPEACQMRAFLPIFRASATMMRTMDAAYREGWGGHCEGTWPTLALAHGLDLVDPGGDGPLTPARYRGRFYTNTPQQTNLAPGTLVFKPPLYRVGTRPDMLWHPVKPFFWRTEIKQGLRDIKRSAGVVVRAMLGWWTRRRIAKAAIARRTDARAG